MLFRDGVPTFVETSVPRALARDEIAGIVQDYANAARHALAAGFDGVEIHGANGYLVDQFLRSGSNRREDDYGGGVEGRTRFAVEVVRAVADAIGADRTGLRLSPVTPANDAHDPEPQPLFEHLVRALGPLGLAFLHVIEGSTGAERDFQQGERPFDYAALRKAAEDPGYRRRLSELSAVIAAGEEFDPAHVDALVPREVEKYRRLLRD